MSLKFPDVLFPEQAYLYVRGEVRGSACDVSYLHFNKVWTAQLHQFGIVANFIGVPRFHQCQSVHRALTLNT